MSALIIIALVVLTISFYQENKDLRSKISKGNNINYCPKCGYNLRNNNPINTPQQASIPSNNSITKKTTKKKYNEKELKNNLILITGSILLILSALVFLGTTWNTSNDILKFIILFTMLIVFISTSYIANNILNLKNTAKAFYYISLSREIKIYNSNNWQRKSTKRIFDTS